MTTTEQPTGVPGLTAAAHGRVTLTDWVYEQLKKAIVDLSLAPGSPMREAALAAALGVSKTPIREALAWLERDGLVETEVFKGAVVTGYSNRDLVEIYELRDLLESAAARQLASEADAATLTRLRKLMEASRSALVEGGSQKKLASLISEFDTVLFDSIHNQRILAIINNLHNHLTRIGNLAESIPGRLEQSVADHERIVEAIVLRDPEKAGAAMHEHIVSVQADQLRAMDPAKA